MDDSIEIGSMHDDAQASEKLGDARTAGRRKRPTRVKRASPVLPELTDEERAVRRGSYGSSRLTELDPEAAVQTFLKWQLRP